MRLIQKKMTHFALTNKCIRAYNLSTIFVNDALCSLSWHFSGGKGHYTRNFNEIVNTHSWCFIVGCNNSGTSLLHRILENSSMVSTLLYEGQMYTRVFRRAREKGFARIWSEYANELAMPADSHLEKGPRLLHDWLRDIPKPVQRVIVEKTPANVLRMGWLQQIFPTSCFIGLVRNGYAVAEGILRKGNQEPGRGARHWNAVNKTMIKESEKIRRFLLVRYEDLAENPYETLEQVAGFIDIEYGELKKAAQNSFSFKTVSGSEPTTIKNFNFMSIERLTPEDIATIRENASEMLDYFGYKPE